MSTIKVTNLRGRNGSPTLPDGAVVTGVATATSFDGNLKSTGTPTLGLGVTINASGLAISGVATAGIGSFTTVYGDGSNMTGVGESIAPWYYNPDVSQVDAYIDTGIGITFNKKILAGAGGSMTLRLVGAAGTVVQNWGISSITIPDATSFNASLVSNLENNTSYHLTVDSGFIVDSNETSYVGTAYTFDTSGTAPSMFTVGENANGQLAQNTEGDSGRKSSPVQIPGNTWTMVMQGGTLSGQSSIATKTDGTAWVWGANSIAGTLGLNDAVSRSSPTQLGSDTTWGKTAHTLSGNQYGLASIKTDGTLWIWGNNANGQLGQNAQGSPTRVSSPVQVPGTTWRTFTFTGRTTLATKTDNTLWSWGYNGSGILGQNSQVQYSSPIQIPGTTWKSTSVGSSNAAAIKTDGTLWTWGHNGYGQLGQNGPVNSDRSSPIQIPGTTWANVCTGNGAIAAVKTDGTLWTWGENNEGELAQNSLIDRSSPVQVPGTTWSTDLKHSNSDDGSFAWIKTDGTLWVWGANVRGQLGQNQNDMEYSSPVQIPGIWTTVGNAGEDAYIFLGTDLTP